MRSLPRLLLLLFSLAWVAACGSDSTSTSFQVRTSLLPTSGTTPIEVGGTWLTYRASEALTGPPPGTDLNGDMDTIDDLVVAVELGVDNDTLVGVSAVHTAIAGGQIYMDVDEAVDGMDWNGINGATDRVLLHWSDAAGAITFLDTLNPRLAQVSLVLSGSRVYYSSDTVSASADGTSLRYLESTAPTTIVAVEARVGSGTADPILLGEAQGLIFLSRSEAVGGGDLNNDLDMGDQFVLGLLDGTDPAARLENAALAVRDTSAPVAALARGTGDWLTAFLVNEADQGNVSLNNPALFTNPTVPLACAGMPDLDMLDDVLFYVEFADFVLGLAPPVNTGLAGRDRVVVVSDYVATTSPEAEANCNLNQDMDTLDTVARWVETVTPVAPPVDPNELLALQTMLPGGSFGLSTLDSRLVTIVDEAQDSRNHDGKVQDHDLVSWLEPTDGATAVWNFSHQGTTSSFGTAIFEDVNGDGLPDPNVGQSEPYAGASWFSAAETNGRLPVTFLEQVPGTNPNVAPINNNVECGFFPKDADLIDALPVWLDFEDRILDFDGIGFAVAAANAGIVVAAGSAYFRVDEAADGFDHNGDNVADDMVLMRNFTTTCNPTVMGNSTFLTGPVIVTDGVNGAGFLHDETMDGVDMNGDGDADDIVLSSFRF